VGRSIDYSKNKNAASFCTPAQFLFIGSQLQDPLRQAASVLSIFILNVIAS